MIDEISDIYILKGSFSKCPQVIEIEDIRAALVSAAAAVQFS
jgi:hypothetical protein